MNFFKKEKNPEYTDLSQLPCVKEIKELENIRIYRLTGPIDMETVPDMETMEKKAEMDKGMVKKDVIVDFKDVTHIDSSTCAALVRAFATVKHDNYKFALVNVTKDLKSLMDISKITPLFSIYNNEEEAIEAFKA